MITQNSPRGPPSTGPPASRRSRLVGRPPVGPGALAGCGRAAPGCSNERRRLPRARHSIVSRLMSSRGPAVTLRPISRSAATAFSLGPGEPARELDRLTGPAAVSHTHQAQAPPLDWRHSPHPSLCPVLSGNSTSAASIQATTCRSRLLAASESESSFTSGTRWPLTSHRVRPTRVVQATDPAATAGSGRRLSPGAQTIVSTPGTRAVSVPS
jgi:hypothetical protein